MIPLHFKTLGKIRHVKVFVFSPRYYMYVCKRYLLHPQYYSMKCKNVPSFLAKAKNDSLYVAN